MRTFAIGDIHGGLKALIQLLNKLEIKQEDKLIFLGDYVDGWSESAQVIQFLIELSEKIKHQMGLVDFVKLKEWIKNSS